MTCQCNGSYRPESRNIEIPADQVNSDTATKFVSVQDQQHTIFRTINSNHTAVNIHEKRGEWYCCVTAFQL